MLDSPLIEVAIGLSFVFLLLSLLVSSVCEMLAGLFRWRAQYLWAGIETLLQSPEARARLYGHPLVKGLAPMKVMHRPVTGRVGKALDSLGLRFGDGPAYIPSRTFALALIDVVREPHAVAADVESRITALIDQGTRSPTTLAASFGQLLQRVESDPALSEVAARIQEVRQRIFQAVDPAVLKGLQWQVESVLAAVPTSGQGSLGPVTEWLAAVAGARNYVELRATLADAVAAMPVTQPAARECRAALEGILSRFTLGSPDEIARELQQFIAQSREVRHALSQANESLRGLAGSLRPLLDDAAGDVERFRDNVETWFNNSMDRVSGAYKRHTLGWQAAIGLVLALSMNVDTLQITRSLWHDRALRQVLVAQAEAVAQQEQPPSGAAAQFATLHDQVTSLGLPIGWRACAAPSANDAVVGTPLLWCDEEWAFWALVPMLFGWCLTAAAVSLGAPFWFDTLKRFVSIRSSGKSPDERGVRS